MMYAGMGQDEASSDIDGTFDTYESRTAPVAMVESTSPVSESDFLAALLPINPSPAAAQSTTTDLINAGLLPLPSGLATSAATAGGVSGTQALVILGILLAIVFWTK